MVGSPLVFTVLGVPFAKSLVGCRDPEVQYGIALLPWKRHSLMRPLEGLVEAESSSGQQRKAWKAKGKSEKDRKVSLKEKNTFLFTGAASGLWRAAEGSKVCLEADNPTPCTLCAPVPDHPSSSQFVPVPSWTGEHQLGRSHGAEGRGGPDPRAQGAQQEFTGAAFTVMPKPSSLHELLPFPPSFWCNNLFLIDIFIPNTGKMPEW